MSKADTPKSESPESAGTEKVVFLATAFDKTNPISSSMSALEADKRFIVLHPLFNWQSAKAKEVLSHLELSLSDLPSCKDQWRQVLMRDYWAISQSSLVVYDVDKSPGEQFLAASVIYEKPLVLTSASYAALPYPHFSGFARAMVKPEDLAATIALLLG